MIMKQIFHMQKGELFSLSISYRHLRLNTKANLIKNLSNLHKTNSTTFSFNKTLNRDDFEMNLLDYRLFKQTNSVNQTNF